MFCAHSRSGELEDVRAVELQGVVRMARELQVPLPHWPHPDRVPAHTYVHCHMQHQLGCRQGVSACLGRVYCKCGSPEPQEGAVLFAWVIVGALTL